MAAIGSDALARLAPDRKIAVGIKVGAADERNPERGERHERAPPALVPVPPLSTVDRRNHVVAQSRQLHIREVGAPHSPAARPGCEAGRPKPLLHELLLKRSLLDGILLQPLLHHIALDALLLQQLLVVALIGFLQLEP